MKKVLVIAAFISACLATGTLAWYGLENENPGAALQKLHENMERDPEVLRTCHQAAHNIGARAYRKYQDVAKALSYKDDLCGSGYFHGVIETYIGSTPDLENVLNGLCDRYSDKFDKGNCYHGLGHGLMFINNNDIPKSLAYCESLIGKPAKIQCNEGVFMENFNSNEDTHFSEYLNPQDLFSVCRSRSLPYQKATCYFYAPLFYLNHHVNQYTQAFNWCTGAEVAFQDSCIKGVASRATKENITNVPMVENLCAGLQEPNQAGCIEGLASYYLTEYSNLNQARAMCKTLRQEFQDICLLALR